MKISNKLALLIVVIMLFIGAYTILYAPKKSSAQQKPIITISPFLRDVRFSGSDATKDFPLKITNNGSVAINFKLNVLDFGSLNDTGGVVFAGSESSALNGKYGLALWLQLSENNITIESNQTKVITATIINDTSLQPGGHYAAIVATVDNEDPSKLDQITINQKLSSLILATKVGGEKYDLTLEKIEPKTSKMHLPRIVSLRFKNLGNVHVVPRGIVKIISSSGTELARGAINEESGYILPETERNFEVNLHGVSNNGLWPALYRVEVDYRYDGIESYAHKERVIYYLNAPNIIFLIIILGVIVLILRKYRLWIRRNCKKVVLKSKLLMKLLERYRIIKKDKLVNNIIKNTTNKLLKLKKPKPETVSENAAITDGTAKKVASKNKRNKKKLSQQKVLLWSEVERITPKNVKKASRTSHKKAKKPEVIHKTNVQRPYIKIDKKKKH